MRAMWRQPTVEPEVVSQGEGGPDTYYHYSALKKPGWTWEIVLYFFLGGLAAASYLIATLADLFGGPNERPVARTGRYLSLVSTLLCPVLLTVDLGRPERFRNMLRIFKSRSPMSVGTWGLSGFGFFVGVGILRQAIEDDLLGRKGPLLKIVGAIPMPFFGIMGSLFAFFVSSYTGVLLGFTNVPLWAKNHLLQGPLFLTSALSSGLSAISLLLSLRGKAAPETRAWLGTAESAASLGELGLLAGSFAALGPLARPLRTRPYALPFWLGAVVLGHLLPLILRSGAVGKRGRLPHSLDIVANLSVLAGGLIFRWVTVMAGLRSVDEPRYYLAYTGNGRRNGRRGGVAGDAKK